MTGQLRAIKVINARLEGKELRARKWGWVRGGWGNYRAVMWGTHAGTCHPEQVETAHFDCEFGFLES